MSKEAHVLRCHEEVEGEEVDGDGLGIRGGVADAVNPLIDGPSPQKHHEAAQELHGDQPRLPPPHAREVHRVDDGRPEELQAERPRAERKNGLVSIAHLKQESPARSASTNIMQDDGRVIGSDRRQTLSEPLFGLSGQLSFGGAAEGTLTLHTI